MKCSNLQTCEKPILIFKNNIYICKNCNSIYEKKSKNIFCCNNKKVNEKYNIPFCNNCYTILTFF